MKTREHCPPALRGAATLGALALLTGAGCNGILDLEPPQRRPDAEGLCAEIVCEASGPCRAPGVCDPATGACSDPPAEDGTQCDDDNPCTISDSCHAGACGGASWVPDGTACDDGDACTQADTCQNGACEGAVPVLCPEPDGCHDGGACDPATGACVYQVFSDGTACDDGDACTLTDTCLGGACVGAEPVICPDLGPCRLPSACDPATGACSNEPAPDGSPCNDGSVCTAEDTCTAGACNPDGDHTWPHWNPETPKGYIVTGDVVIDTVTGLTWQRGFSPQPQGWALAPAYCASLSLPGYPSGWRLPKRNELISIVDYTKANPAIDTAAFPGTPAEIFWTSSPNQDYPDYGSWGVDFTKGQTEIHDTHDVLRVRCVH